MIRFVHNGLLVDEDGWHAADPRNGSITVYSRNGSITVYFHGQPAVTLDDGFLRRAVDLLDYDRVRHSASPNREDSKE